MTEQQEFEVTIPVVSEPVAGWLLFYCLLLTFALPVTYLYGVFSATLPRLLSTQSASEKLLLIVYLAVFTQVVLFGVTAGLKLWLLKPGAVAIARRFLWIYLISHLLYFLLCLLLIRPRQTETVAALGWYHVVAPIGAFYLWFTYLEHSKRVRRTYHVP